MLAPGTCLPLHTYGCAMKFGCSELPLNAFRIASVLRSLTPFSAVCMFMTELKPACAIESRATFFSPYFCIAATITLVSSLPLSSESNGCAKYRPSAASPAVLSAGGDVHGSIPKIFALLPTDWSALRTPGQAFGELT